MKRALVSLTFYLSVAAWLAFAIAYISGFEDTYQVTAEDWLVPSLLESVSIVLVLGVVPALFVATLVSFLRDRWFGVLWNAITLTGYIAVRYFDTGTVPVAFIVIAGFAIACAVVYVSLVARMRASLNQLSVELPGGATQIFTRQAHQNVSERANSPVLALVPIWVWIAAVLSIAISLVWFAYDTNKMSKARAGAVTTTAVVESIDEDGFATLSVPMFGEMSCSPITDGSPSVGDEVQVLANPQYNWCEDLNAPFEPGGALVWGVAGYALLFSEIARAYNNRRPYAGALTDTRALPLSVDTARFLVAPEGYVYFAAASDAAHERRATAANEFPLGAPSLNPPGGTKFVALVNETGFREYFKFHTVRPFGAGIIDAEFVDDSSATEEAFNKAYKDAGIEPPDWEDDEAFETWAKQEQAVSTANSMQFDARAIRQLASKEPTAFLLLGSLKQDYALLYLKDVGGLLRVRLGDAQPVEAGTRQLQYLDLTDLTPSIFD